MTLSSCPLSEAQHFDDAWLLTMLRRDRRSLPTPSGDVLHVHALKLPNELRSLVAIICRLRLRMFSLQAALPPSRPSHPPQGGSALAMLGTGFLCRWFALCVPALVPRSGPNGSPS